VPQLKSGTVVAITALLLSALTLMRESWNLVIGPALGI
jgi:hypothetical protein